jgi:hypothetical protein
LLIGQAGAKATENAEQAVLATWALAKVLRKKPEAKEAQLSLGRAEGQSDCVHHSPELRGRDKV